MIKALRYEELRDSAVKALAEIGPAAVEPLLTKFMRDLIDV